MGDTKMNDGDHLDDYNEVDQDGKPLGTKFGDEIYYEPFTPKLPRGSVEDVRRDSRW